jgi:hypothetical protein
VNKKTIGRCQTVRPRARAVRAKLDEWGIAKILHCHNTVAILRNADVFVSTCRATGVVSNNDSMLES